MCVCVCMVGFYVVVQMAAVTFSIMLCIMCQQNTPLFSSLSPLKFAVVSHTFLGPSKCSKFCFGFVLLLKCVLTCCYFITFLSIIANNVSALSLVFTIALQTYLSDFVYRFFFCVCLFFSPIFNGS